MIHLNTAGAGLVPAEVRRTMAEVLDREAAAGCYETESFYDDVVNDEVYRRLARILDAPVADVALFDSATRAWCAVVPRLDLGPGDRVWVTPYEYAGNLISLFELRDRTGCTIEVVPLLPSGDLDLDWMAAHIDDDVALVSVTHIPSGCGIVNPVEEIGRLLAPHRCFYAVDACQSIGQVPVSAARIGCQLLTGAGRKFLRGPRGTAFAYVAPELRAALLPGFHDLHVAHVDSATGYRIDDRSARSLELAERSTAAVAGLNTALTLFEEGKPFDHEDVFGALRAAVTGAPGVELIAPGTKQSGILTFRHADVDAATVMARLAEQRINVWKIVGHHTPIYMADRGVDTAVRVSAHYYNTPEEMDVFGRALREALGAGA
ncbi:aminotransferase class V-fold PLP-dependent enzyme [Streptomyces sp. MBT67]|uniref:aminotransferase class V-fold PLP-dependent enzyme n=1 Tax=unclassified Streptomyces TaxID=2593676 RepID=UPI0019091CDA|nr:MULTISPECIES: aminotransferase class V-fold PLP-dependent enzyme [unclassified Streptomyces]MBK3529156.1 aminotransferase class V-fold PLP-dependent enzyme [Streptomyces sp. MBT72]MBK3535708.1 aminotransferase class V-fold PLP-dependent enzyme [Streptomyces sp. MBT67]MBK3548987.1 aminotransferase class V-fold PLP-dependent enzyme [Streptomyces sp. MBT61]MBK6030994.1 aminotransferase class V-fold PLP-dependent enzyme [Streptomyces sp. MBT59]